MHEKNLTGLEIAVIGMAGRYPGARDIHEFWENLKNGREAITYFSEEELTALHVDPRLVHDPDYVKAASILDEVEYFDAAFFGYTPREAEIMVPQVRLFHEGVWHALEDAGVDPQAYKGTIGLYAGSSSSAYWEALAALSGKRANLGDFATNLLADKDMLTTRVSYNINLSGPSVTVVTACSTSLVAIHLACQGINSGECKMAAAGGVTVTLPRNYGYLYQEGLILSTDGHCRTFDARTGGALLGEGMGVVILKSYEDALREGDHVYAVIIGTAVNNDGSGKVGYTAPGVKGQAGVIRAALHAAEVEPETISYIETHGTGTKMGDAIEIKALKLAFNTSKKNFCRIGSVKSNLGHLVHAAGVTGFIKTVLSLEHKLIPPSLFFETPEPGTGLEDSPFVVNTRLAEWKTDGSPRRAGVSSFGIGGTNAHVVLEEHIGGETVRETAGGIPVGHPGQENDRAKESGLILLSARTPTACERMAENLSRHIQGNPNIDLADMAYTLQVGRRVFPYRCAVVCSQIEQAIKALAPGSRKKHLYHAKEEKKTVIFMFPGIGAQYVNMGLGLYRRHPLFREEMDRCFALLKPILGYDFKEVLYPASGAAQNPPSHTSPIPYQPHPAYGSSELNNMEIAQLVIFIVEYSLAKLLMRWGIQPQFMIGYSFGEYTAACISGVFTLEQALNIIAARGRLIGSQPTGTMLSVPLPAAEILPLLQDDLSLAIDNGPSCIIAGSHRALESLQNRLKEKRLLCMTLPNSHALHSKMMEPVLQDFETLLRRLRLNKLQIPYISNVTGKSITEKEAIDPMYWCRHLKETVQFARGIDSLMEEPNPIFIEIGPGRDLSTLLVRHKDDGAKHRAVSLVRPRQLDTEDDYYLLSNLGRVWSYGVGIDWQAFNAGERRLRLSLPVYPFEGKPYWLEGTAGIGEQMMAANSLPKRIRIENGNEGNQGNMEERPGLSSEYAPPTDEIEEKMVLLWQDCFGLRQVGIEDDFFELGGDSLLAGTMVSRLHREIGIPVPLAEVFNLPTIKKLAAYARGRKRIPIDITGKIENLVFLKAARAENAPNLFCIHDIGGEVEGYIEFCNRLEMDFNFWGIRADRIKDYTPANVSVQELAERYLKAVRALQPQGPYYFIGWSFGGFVGFEMVRLLEQMEQMREEIKIFAAVDAFIFKEGLAGTGSDFSLQSELNWLREFLPETEIKDKANSVSGISQLWPLIVSYLESGEFGSERLREILPQNMSLIVPNFQRLTPGELIFNMNMLRTFNRAMNTFKPSGKIRTPVHFFKAGQALWEVQSSHWEECSTTQVKFHEVPGNHFSIFTMPDVMGLVEKFRDIF